jgi:hypothetical protein
MSAVQIQGNASGTGTLTIAAPNTNTNQTLTLPDLTGTFMVNGPAFSATVSTNQSISANTATKVAFDTKTFDTNTNFSTVNNRFTPTVAGYYQATISIYTSTSGVGVYQVLFYKNGSLYKSPIYNVANATAAVMANATSLIYMNGSTDYLEAYWQSQNASTIGGAAGTAYTEFSGVLVRSA